MRSILIFILIITLIGCAARQKLSDFFGIQVFKGKPIDEVLSNVRYTPDLKVEYTYSRNFTDRLVHAYGKIRKDCIDFTLYNESKVPIKMNYLTDEYYVSLADGSVHKLEISTGIRWYPDVLNPQTGKDISVWVPYSLKKRTEEIIQAVIIVNYGETVIGLTRIDKSQIETGQE